MLGATMLMASDTSDVDVYGAQVKLRLRNANENDGERVIAQALCEMVLTIGCHVVLVAPRSILVRHGVKQTRLLCARNISQVRVGDVAGEQF